MSLIFYSTFGLEFTPKFPTKPEVLEMYKNGSVVKYRFFGLDEKGKPSLPLLDPISDPAIAWDDILHYRINSDRRIAACRICRRKIGLRKNPIAEDLKSIAKTIKPKEMKISSQGIFFPPDQTPRMVNWSFCVSYSCIKGIQDLHLSYKTKSKTSNYWYAPFNKTLLLESSIKSELKEEELKDLFDIAADAEVKIFEKGPNLPERAKL